MGIGVYNGFTGAERMAVLKRVQRAEAIGYWPTPTECEVCGQTDGRIGEHNEDYADPQTCIPLCAVCHMMIHCRFTMARRTWDEYRDMVRDGWMPPGMSQAAVMGYIRGKVYRGDYSDGTVYPLHAQERTFLDLLPMERQTEATSLGYNVITRAPLPPLPTLADMADPEALLATLTAA